MIIVSNKSVWETGETWKLVLLCLIIFLFIEFFFFIMKLCCQGELLKRISKNITKAQRINESFIYSFFIFSRLCKDDISLLSESSVSTFAFQLFSPYYTLYLLMSYCSACFQAIGTFDLYTSFALNPVLHLV